MVPVMNSHRSRCHPAMMSVSRLRGQRLGSWPNHTHGGCAPARRAAAALAGQLLRVRLLLLRELPPRDPHTRVLTREWEAARPTPSAEAGEALTAPGGRLRGRAWHGRDVPAGQTAALQRPVPGTAQACTEPGPGVSPHLDRMETVLCLPWRPEPTQSQPEQDKSKPLLLPHVPVGHVLVCCLGLPFLWPCTLLVSPAKDGPSVVRPRAC